MMKPQIRGLPEPEPKKIRLDDVLDALRDYVSDSDLESVREAYTFSAQAHSGQKRRSGEPFLSHPLSVALLLAEMKLDVPTVVTGLLHDTVEDTNVTLAKIKESFGEQVAQLVDGVTKLSKIHFSSREARQAENFRKMFMAMAEDIRVILIKLADRLHNMRTLEAMPEYKRQRIARETLDVYAAIAGRLGMQEMKIELEERSFYFLKPELWKKVDDQVAQLKKTSGRFIEEIQETVGQALAEHNIEAVIQGRFKHYYSIYRKMAEQNLDFDQIYDVLGFRVVVDTATDCYGALGIIHSIWRPVPGRFKDYIGMPKLNNYQSLHTTVIGPRGQRVEFQIRTQEMHEVAEWGIAAHWMYKEKGSIAEKDEMKFRWLRQFVEWQKDVSDPAEYLDIVKLDLFATDVYVFTPKGDIREFPQGSTPVDFAYSVHTDVGHQCVGARVNGRIVPLRYHLKSGDTVEILTRSDHVPSKDWLKFVKTSRARSKIRQLIRVHQREKAQVIGRDILEKEFAKYGVELGQELKQNAVSQFMKNRGLATLSELMSQVGYGRITPQQVARAVLSEQQLKQGAEKPKETTLSRIFKRAAKQSRGVIRVQGMDDVLVSIAKCCTPIPGDSVTGFVTRGRGVTVHRTDCSRALAIDPDRRIDVEWDESTETRTLAKIRLLCVDKPGMLSMISKEISAHSVNISTANCRAIGDEKSVNTFEIGVRGVRELQSLMQALEKIKGVIRVDRVTK